MFQVALKSAIELTCGKGAAAPASPKKLTKGRPAIGDSVDEKAFRHHCCHHRRVMGLEHRQRLGAVLKAVVKRPFQYDVFGHAGLRFAVGSRMLRRLVNGVVDTVILAIRIAHRQNHLGRRIAVRQKAQTIACRPIEG